MSEFSSVIPPSEESAEEMVVEIIGINSKYENLKKMVTTMKSEVGDKEFSTKYTLIVFIKILIHALITETIPAGLQERQSAVGPIYALKGTPRKNIFDEIRDIPREKNILLAKKIKKALEDTDKNDSDPTWNQYLEDLKTSYMKLVENKDPKQYEFRVYAPRLEGVKSPGHHIHLNAYDVSEFLSGIEKHIINVAKNHYNIIDYQLGGRKYKRRSLKNKRKTKKRKSMKKRKRKTRRKTRRKTNKGKK